MDLSTLTLTRGPDASERPALDSDLISVDRAQHRRALPATTCSSSISAPSPGPPSATRRAQPRRRAPCPASPQQTTPFSSLAAPPARSSLVRAGHPWGLILFCNSALHACTFRVPGL